MSSQRYISDALKRKKQKVKKVKIYISLFFVLILFIASIFVLRLQTLQIQEVKIEGNIFITTQEIEQKAQDILNKNIAWVIPYRNIFIFPKAQLKESLQANPAIISVEIKKDLFNTLRIQIQEQEKEIIYCTSFEKSECFYINKKGFIYGKVEGILIPEQEIIVYNEKEGKKLKDTLIDETTYIDSMLFVKNLARQDIKIKEIYIRSDDTIDFVSRDATRFVTSIFDEFKKDFENLIALFDQQVITKEQLNTIEYIDLRFGNKVFYKNKTN